MLMTIRDRAGADLQIGADVDWGSSVRTILSIASKLLIGLPPRPSNWRATRWGCPPAA